MFNSIKNLKYIGWWMIYVAAYIRTGGSGDASRAAECANRYFSQQFPELEDDR